MPDKLDGVLAMGAALAVLFLLPWLDRSPVKSIRYRGWLFKSAFALFVVSFPALGYLGALPPSPGRTALAQVCSVIYFAYFLLMPLYTRLDLVNPVPQRVTMGNKSTL